MFWSQLTKPLSSDALIHSNIDTHFTYLNRTSCINVIVWLISVSSMTYFMIFGQEMFWGGELTREGEGQGNLFKTNWRPTSNLSVFYPYFTQIWVLYESGWKLLIFKTKKVQTLQWGGAQQRGKVIRVLTATTIRTPIVGVFNEWK